MFLGQFVRRLTARTAVVLLAEMYLGALVSGWPGPEGFVLRYALSKLTFGKLDGFCFICPGARLVHSYGLVAGRMFNVNSGAQIDARGGHCW